MLRFTRGVHCFGYVHGVVVVPLGADVLVVGQGVGLGPSRRDKAGRVAVRIPVHVGPAGMTEVFSGKRLVKVIALLRPFLAAMAGPGNCPL